MDAPSAAGAAGGAGGGGSSGAGAASARSAGDMAVPVGAGSPARSHSPTPRVKSCNSFSCRNHLATCRIACWKAPSISCIIEARCSVICRISRATTPNGCPSAPIFAEAISALMEIIIVRDRMGAIARLTG